jgi:hypothetical protein
MNEWWIQAVLVGLRATCYTSIPRDFFQCPRAALNYSQKNPTDKNLDFCFSKLFVVVSLINIYLGYTTEDF